jgi:20S proteasome alpha/beta subunit
MFTNTKLTNPSLLQNDSLILKLTVVLATDQVNARSILMYQQNLDKIAELSSHSAMGVSGPNCDLVNFSE